MPREADAVVDEFVQQAQQVGTPRSGHHNRNYVMPLSARMARLVGREQGTCVLVRSPQTDVVRVVIRTWSNEADLLGAVNRLLPHTPKCLARTESATVLSYTAGTPLSHLCPDGRPVDSSLISELAHLLARTTVVRREALPPLPERWPRDDDDSQAYLRTLAHMADEQIRQPSWPVYRHLFRGLGVPEDGLIRFAENVPAMTRRPYGLVHADLHRGNVIVTDHDDLPLVAVDWELATYGDPLHDLATHLVRMRYPESQRDDVIEAWREAAGLITPAAVKSMEEDLTHYIAFEQAQSVFPDVIRAANSLVGSARRKNVDLGSLDRAALSVRHALRAGGKHLGVRTIPSETKVRDLLCQWQESRARQGAEPQAAATPGIREPLGV